MGPKSNKTEVIISYLVIKVNVLIRLYNGWMKQFSGAHLFEVSQMAYIDPKMAERVRDPELVRRHIGRAIQLSGSVEAEVGASGAIPERMLPRMHPHFSRFLGYWYPQEHWHGVSQLVLLDILGLEPLPQKAVKVTNVHKALGIFAKASDTAHDIAELGILTYMSLGELETEEAYRSMAGIMTRIGEPDLAKLFGRTAHQETVHLGFQSTRAKELAAQMPGWAVHTTGRIIEKIYYPVGVDRKSNERKAAMGHMINTICDDNGVALAYDVAVLAHSMLPAISKESDFAYKGYAECLEELVA